MFEEWRRSWIEKKFRHLKVTLKSDCVEVTPFVFGRDYSIKFTIHRTFISFNQLCSLLKVIDDTFFSSWIPNEPPSNFRLNDSTIESAKFVKQLLKTDLPAEIKLILAVTGAYSVKHLGLEQTLTLLSEQNGLYSGKSFQTNTSSSEELATRVLIIFPGVNYSLDDRRPVSLNEVEKFFASEQALKVAQFLAYDQDNDLSFDNFRQMSIETLNYASDRQFSTASLLVALEIVENSSMEIMGQITAEQLLSISSEMRPGQPALYPMDVILSRPRKKKQHKSRDGWPVSKIRCLDVLTQFVTPEELLILEQQAKELDLIPKLSRFALFDEYGNADPERSYGSTAPILSVLAEIAVNKGVYKYAEVVEVITGIFPTRYRNWETLIPEVRINLVDLAMQILSDDHDEIILRWVLAMTGHLPFDVGPECRYQRGQIRMIVR